MTENLFVSIKMRLVSTCRLAVMHYCFPSQVCMRADGDTYIRIRVKWLYD